MVAKAFADSHYPAGTFRPDGARLRYSVTDADEDWRVELGPEGYMGGGLQVVIRKRDMTVVSSGRTQ